MFWTGRSARLGQLLKNVRHSRDLIDVEALAASIANAHQFFSDTRVRFEEEFKYRKSCLYQVAENWLDPLSFADDIERFEQILDLSAGSVLWLISHPKF